MNKKNKKRLPDAYQFKGFIPRRAYGLRD